MAFDVKRTMPDYDYSPKAQRAIKSVNLMCFLLDDVTYNQLYVEDFRLALDRILNRARLLDDYDATKLPSLNDGAYTPANPTMPGIPGMPIKDWIVRALEDIKGYLVKPLYLGDLFHTQFGTTTPPDTSTPEYKLWARFRQMYISATHEYQGVRQNELEHFCCPVIAFQEGPRQDLLQKGVLESFLDEFGDMTMYELFTKQRKRLNKVQIDQLQAAREAKILTDATDKYRQSMPDPTEKHFSTMTPLTFPASNELQCNYTTSTCYSHPNFECFCNDANGSCSAMSYP